MMDDDDIQSSGTDTASTDMIELTFRETMNLLEPDTRIVSHTELEGYFQDKKAAVNVFLKPQIEWMNRIAPYVKVEVRAEEDNPQGKFKKGDFSEDPTCLAYAMSEMELDLESMEPSVNHVPKKVAAIHRKELCGSTIDVSGKRFTPEQHSSIMLCGAQTIGHKVLLGSYNLVGCVVVYPGQTQDDAAEIEHDPAQKISFASDKVVNKEKLDASAIIVVPRPAHPGLADTYDSEKFTTKHETMRHARVDRVRITLLRYVELLEGERVRAKKMLNSDLKKTPRPDSSIADKNMMLARIDEMIATAKSYYAEGGVPGTNILPRNCDPAKVVLDLHTYTIYEAKSLRDMPFTAINGVERTTESDEVWEKNEERGHKNIRYLANSRNRCVLELCMAFKKPGVTKITPVNHRAVRFKLTIPIVDDYVWLFALHVPRFRDVYLAGPPKPSGIKRAPSGKPSQTTKKTESEDENEESAGESEAEEDEMPEPQPTKTKLVEATKASATSKHVKSAVDKALKQAASAKWVSEEKDLPKEAAEVVENKPATPAKKPNAVPVATPASPKKIDKKRKHEASAPPTDADESLLIPALPERSETEGTLIDKLTSFIAKLDNKQAAGGQLPNSYLHGPFHNYDGGALNEIQSAALMNVVCFSKFTRTDTLYGNVRAAETKLLEERLAKRPKVVPAEMSPVEIDFGFDD